VGAVYVLGRFHLSTGGLHGQHTRLSGGMVGYEIGGFERDHDK
jgi:hypothetical protein